MKKNNKILFFVTEDWYFISHRIKLAEHLIKKGSGRGGIVYKDKEDITEFVSPGDEVKLKFKTGRWDSGHWLTWNYWKDLHLEFE